MARKRDTVDSQQSSEKPPLGDAANDAERRAEQEQEDPGIPDSDDAPVEDEPETALVPAEIADEVGQALALREQAVAPTSSIPLPAEWNALSTMAHTLANSRVVPEAYRGRPDDVIAAWLFGRELGLGQMTALRDIYMVDGRAVIAAHRQLGLMRTGGIRLIESEATDERARIVAQRQDTGEIMEVSFTWEEAQRVKRKNGKQLVEGDNWRNYRSDMLWARCVGRLSRRLGPDLMGSLPPYVAEEVADFSGWGVEYGGDDVLTLRRGEVREDQGPPWDHPESWVELGERSARILGEDEWDAWRLEIVRAKYGVSRVSDIPEGGDVAWRPFQMFLRELESWEPQHELDPIPRTFVQKAAAAAFDGIAVEGPEWRLSPDEQDRPAHAQEASSPESPDEQEPDSDQEPEIEDAVIVEEYGAEPQEAAELDRQDAEYRQSLADDIDTELVAIDKKRRAATGTTYKEILAHYTDPGALNSIPALEEISENLRAYAMLTATQMKQTSFDAFCASQNQISFG